MTTHRPTTPQEDGPMTDHQLRRWAEARARHHDAHKALERAVTEFTAATRELETAGAALAERVQIGQHRTATTLFPGRAA